MESNEQTLLSQSEQLFSKKQDLLSLWQEYALHFYPERADFTVTRNIGEEFASHLTTSHPVKVARDLANVFSTMLRPRQKQWFSAKTSNYEYLSDESKDFLEFISGSMKNAMGYSRGGFTRSTKEGDHDMAVFGNTAISCEMNWKEKAPLWRNWHLRDMAWCEDVTGAVGRVDRKGMLPARVLMQLFNGNVHQRVKDCAAKEPYKEIEYRHFVIPTDEYDNGKKYKNKYVSIFYDPANKFVMEERNIDYPYYIIPRWKTISGSQYAYSPATVAGISDARMLQDMMLVLIEAGQKSVDPPMIAVTEAIRSDVNLFAGALIPVDSSYDERLGEVLRPIKQDYSGINIGLELIQATKTALVESFYLNKIGLPPMGSGMSQLEVSQRVQEYVMNGLPLFEPLEDEYNSQICSQLFDVMMAGGFVGFRPNDIPEELLGEEIIFTFENPLRDAADKVKGSQYLEIKGLIAQAINTDPSVAQILDDETALRDVIEGIGGPRKWIRSEEEMDALKQAAAEQQQAMQLINTIKQGAEAGQAIGDAGQSLAAIGGEGII